MDHLTISFSSEEGALKTKEKKKSQKNTFLEVYENLKSQYPQYIFMIRIGSFYEFYGEQALLVSSILNIKLRHFLRYGGDFYSCGFPAKSLKKFLTLLLKEGLYLAQCEEESSHEDNIEKNKKNCKKRYISKLFLPCGGKNCFTSSDGPKPVSYEGLGYSPVLKAKQQDF